jgi:uncharacterized HhH-GPD family protein
VDGGRPDRAEVARRLQALPVYGEQKARIFLALLGKQLGVRPEGWREADGDYGVEGSCRSIADVTDAASLSEVRAFKRESKAAARARGLTPGSLTQWVTDSLIPGPEFLDRGYGIP